MADKSKIEWTDATWTPIRARILKTGKIGWHCEHATTGCINCYAESINKRLGTGLPFKPGHRADIEIFLDEEMLLAPLRWKKPRMVFVCSMTDLFADFVPDEWIDKVFAVMALAPQHTFQVLTKRAERMRDYCSVDDRAYAIGSACGEMLDGDWIWNEGKKFRRQIERTISALHGIEFVGEEELPDGSMTLGDERQFEGEQYPLPNVWLGVSCERQQEADERVPFLMQTPAAVRFVSAEPLLGPINLKRIQVKGHGWQDVLTGWRDCTDYPGRELLLDWIIVGGESGKDARPMHPQWARGIRDQCEAAGVSFFFKQWGEWAPHRPVAGGDLGGDVRAGLAKIVHPTGQSIVEVAIATGGRSTIPGSRYMKRVGKKAAGRLLDGVEHNGMPARP